MKPKARIVLLLLLIVAIGVSVVLLRTPRNPATPPSRPASPDTAAASHAADAKRTDAAPRNNEGGGTVEICGHGNVPLDKDDAGAINQYVGGMTKDTGARWLAALQNSSDLRARVTGLLLEGKVTGGESLRPVADSTRNEVVQLVAGSTDSAAYALALSLCGSDSDVDSACRRLSLQRWASIDSDNAVPWILLAGEARTRHDSGAEVEAFKHAAAAHKIDSYADSVFAFAEPELPPDATPLERSYLATEVVSLETTIRLTQYGIAGQYCAPGAMQDSTVRTQCAYLANLAVTKGSSLLDLGFGIAIGKRAGWPSERVDALTLEQHALMQVMHQESPSDDKLWTCDSIRHTNAYMAQRTQLGESGAARELMERSGETVEDLAKKYTDYVANIRRDP